LFFENSARSWSACFFVVFASSRVREFAPTEEEKWVDEFQHQVGSDVSAVAREMVESVTDPTIQATEASAQ